MTGRVKPIVKKEFRQIARDKRTLGILLFVPAFMLVMFGYALNFDVMHLKLAICDHDRTSVSRDFIDSFIHTEYFDLEYYPSKSSEVDRLLAEGKATAAIIVPADFSDGITSRQGANVQIIVDGTNPTTASSSVGYITKIIQDYSSLIGSESIGRFSGPQFENPIDYRPRIWFNPELRSAKFLVPGLIGFIMMVTAVVSTSLSVVREKELGTMELLSVSPIRPVELILGKTIPYVVISLAATAVILAVGYILFDVTVRGSFILLGIVTLVFLVGCLGLGLLVSTISNSQQVAFMIAVMMTVLPTFLLSGFVFPVRNMPVWVQVITYLVPAKYFMTALRAIILKGVGMGAFWDQMLCLIAFALLTIGVSSVRLRMQLGAFRGRRAANRRRTGKRGDR